MIIGLHGKMGSGKSTLAQELVAILEDHNIKSEVKSFAKPIYELTSMIFQDSIENIKQNKNTIVRPRSFSGLRSYRELLQNIGMELRDLVDIDIWIDALFGKENNKILEDWTGNYKWWIIDDLRFINELDRIKSMGGKVLKIFRDIENEDINKSLSTTLQADIQENQSELDLDNIPDDDWDLIIENNYTLTQSADILNRYITTLLKGSV